MSGWTLLHLLSIGMWCGCVAAEGAVEWIGRRPDEAGRIAARIHYLIDLFVELPILCCVVLSGTVLALQVELTALHWIKIACALTAVAVNVVCIGIVLRRHRQHGEERLQAAARSSRLIPWAFALGFPFAVAAFYLALRAGDARIG